MRETKNEIPFIDHFQLKGKPEIFSIHTVKRENAPKTIQKLKNVYLNPKSEYVSIVMDPMKGKPLYWAETVNWSKLYQQTDYTDTFAKFDGKIIYRSFLEKVDDMLVARIFSFCNIRKNFGQGWYETMRIIFDGVNVGKETREGFEENFNLASYNNMAMLAYGFNYKKLNPHGWEHKEEVPLNFFSAHNQIPTQCLIFESKIKTSAEAFNETYGRYMLSQKCRYGSAYEYRWNYFGHILPINFMEDTHLFYRISNRFQEMRASRALPKNLPAVIREDLSKDYFTNVMDPKAAYPFTSSCDDYECFVKPDYTVWIISKHDKDKNKIEDKRVYFYKNKFYMLCYNPITGSFHTQLIRKGQTLTQFGYLKFKLPKDKNGSLTDRLIGIQEEYMHFFEIQKVLAFPVYEKLYKVFGVFNDFKEPLNDKLSRDIRTFALDYKDFLTSGIGEDRANTFFNAKNPFEALMINRPAVKRLKESQYLARKIKYLISNTYRAKNPVVLVDMLEFLWNKPLKYSDEDMKYFEKIFASHIHSEKTNVRLVDPNWTICRGPLVSPANEKAGIYNDYIKLFEKWTVIYKKLQTMDIKNIDEYDFPRYPKLSQLKHFHDAIVREVNRYYYLYKEANEEKIEEDLVNFVQTNEYTQFINGDDNNYCIKPVENGESLVKEGTYLHHCVGMYKEDMSKQRSYIYFLRKKKQKDIPFITMEINKLNDNTYILHQCHTFYNKPNTDKSCSAFIKKWANNNKVIIKCAV